jgi:hypothetical protein
MARKWMFGLISIVAIAAVAGVGFAAYTATATVTVTANAGSFYLVASGTLTASSLSVGSCTPTMMGNSISMVGNNMLPGDYCNWTFTYTDAGSVGGTYVSWYAPGFSGPGCGQFSFNTPWVVYPVATVAPGGLAAQFYWNITDTGNGMVSGACSDYNTVTYAAA